MATPPISDVAAPDPALPLAVAASLVSRRSRIMASNMWIICSADFPSPNTTSGKPTRRLLSWSIFANPPTSSASAPPETSRGASLAVAADGERSPAATLARRDGKSPHVEELSLPTRREIEIARWLVWLSRWRRSVCNNKNIGRSIDIRHERAC